jgi:transcriptional regulator of acetoin/glycerol metabolism
MATSIWVRWIGTELSGLISYPVAGKSNRRGVVATWMCRKGATLARGIVPSLLYRQLTTRCSMFATPSWRIDRRCLSRRLIKMGHAERIMAVAKDPSACGRSAISASWVRSLTRYGLDPQDTGRPRTLTDRELREARAHVEPLLHAGQCTLDRLFQAVGDTGCCVLFTDRHGVTVDRRGAGADDETFYRWGLWTGTVWSEESEGTNGIGTCLAEQRTLTIHRDQHFHARNTGLSCTVAPIYDHQGRLAAALDVSSCRADLTEGFVGLIAAAVVDAARRIEARHFRAAFPKARIVLAPGSDWGAGALLAVDDDDLIVGATRAARLACDITNASLARVLPADSVLTQPGGHGANFDDAERGVLHRALARAGGNVSLTAKTLGISRATLHRKIKRLGLRQEA